MKKTVQVQNICFRYPHRGFELRIRDLCVDKQEQVAIIGSSGCGKTTLAYLIAGIYVPESGRIIVNDESISDKNDQERRDFRISNIGFIFQEFELIEYLNLEENILLPYFVNKSLTLTREAKEFALELAAAAGLAGKHRRKPGELSQGEKQRLAICRALVTRPAILMADEPTGNLDPETTQSVMQLMKEQARERNTTFIMITHEQGLLKDFDRVIDLTESADKN